MSITAPRTRIPTLVAAVLLPLSLAACTGEDASPGAETPGSTSSPVPTTSQPVAPTPTDSATMADTEAPFGPSCPDLPSTGEGSVGEISSERVAEAVEDIPLLSTLLTAVKAAGLVDTLNSAEDITVFAPTNDAFTSLDESSLATILANRGRLEDVVTAHVVPERIAPNELAGEHQTSNSNVAITVTGSGEEFTVNGTASVVCGNIRAANATVYLIDEVLMP